MADRFCCGFGSRPDIMMVASKAHLQNCSLRIEGRLGCDPNAVTGYCCTGIAAEPSSEAGPYLLVSRSHNLAMVHTGRYA